MDIQTLLHNLHEEVCCSVCMCKFTDPKQLPCLHSFCLQCLNGIQRTSGNKNAIKCPECRQDFPVPGDGNLNALPANFRINSLLDVLAIKECSTSGVKCGNCDTRSEQSSYCFQCWSFWCDDCIIFHNGIKDNKGHYSLALKDFQDRDFENILKRPAFCGKPGHEKKELEFFCKSCEVPICYSCVALLHEGHAKILLEEAANEVKVHFESVIESQKEEVLEKRNKISKLKDKRASIQSQVERAKEIAQRFADNMIAAIEAKKQESFDDADKQAKESLERLEIQQCELENQVKLIEIAIEKTEKLVKRSTSAEIAQLEKSLNTPAIPQEGVSGDSGKQVECDLEDPRHFIFDENETLLHKANSEGIGSFRKFLSTTRPLQSSTEGKGIMDTTVGLEARIVVTTRNEDSVQCYEKRDYVTMEIRNRQGHNCATKAQVQDNKDGTYKISYFAKETGTCQASVKVNGEHVRSSPFEVQVKPRQFRPVLTFGQFGSSAGKLNNPWGLAANEQNEIVVTDRRNNRVQVFSSDGTYLRSFGGKGDQQGQFNQPTGIAFDNDNIIVVDCTNSRVQILSAQGDFLSQFGGEGILDHQLSLPLGLSLDSEGNIVVTDPRNRLIKIFSVGGKFLRKFDGNRSLSYPFHCIQEEGYFIVSDAGDHRIKVFDKEGNFLTSFGMEGYEDGEFNGPRCLSVTKAGHLAVCDSGNHRVQVFELNGKFVTKFGTNGSGNGELNNPISTAVLNDGRIVVSDFGNHCIQIFE